MLFPVFLLWSGKYILYPYLRSPNVIACDFQHVVVAELDHIWQTVRNKLSKQRIAVRHTEGTIVPDELGNGQLFSGILRLHRLDPCK